MFNPHLTGTIQENNFFQFYEDSSIHIEKLFDVINGKLAGCMFRNVISNDVCKQISHNFWNSHILKQRDDNVPAYYVGAYHYEKDLDEYLSEAAETKRGLVDLFKNTTNIFDQFMLQLKNYLKKYNINLKLAEHQQKPAGTFLMRSWSNGGSYVLKPHEDLSQCSAKKQQGFEIQATINYEIVAVNICLENGEEGNLHYWNIQPDLTSRQRLGLEETGYPYCDTLLKNYQKMIIPIRTGDIYCFNGKNIHAVDELKSKSSKRSTISFLLGFIDQNTIVYWT